MAEFIQTEKRGHVLIIAFNRAITRRLVASGATMGCFYIESTAMRQLQAKAGIGMSAKEFTESEKARWIKLISGG